MKPKWTEKFVHIEDLKEYDRNPRSIKDEHYKNLVKSLIEDGYHQRLMVNKDMVIIGGHQRKRALLEAGFGETDKIPVLMPDRLLEGDDFKRINIRDNLPFGEFDFDMLTADFDVDELLEWGMPEEWLPIQEEINEGLTDDDSVPEVPKQATTNLGDLYRLGNHHLMCGDSTVITDVDKLMGGMKADMVFTDPPYGMSLDTDFTSFSGLVPKKLTINGETKNRPKTHKWERIIGDNEDFKPENIVQLLELFLYCKEIFLFGADYYSEHLNNKNEGSWIVWDKKNENLDDSFGNSFEMCWSKQKHKRHIARILWNGINGMDRNNKSDEGHRRHPAQKPTKLIEWFFAKWGKPNDKVVDLYGGSGSTLIACEKTNRKCFMMEISPNYCDVIIKRWEDFTGKKAELIQGGS